ncbi:MAG TPA: signal peptidase I [Candidatus Binataceae bacterium]|nr:signal peptidase I [Candidatus Binataceae bacterium]
MQQSARDIPPFQATPPPNTAPPPKAEKSVAREYAEALVIAVILAVLIRTFLFQAYKIPSGSMEPTLLIGDHILVNKAAYGIRMPDSIFGLHSGPLPYGQYLIRYAPIHRGDVVVFVYPADRTKDFIKRVVGISGDTVQIKDGQVWLNGKPMPDPHAHIEVPPAERSPSNPRDYFGPVTVPKGKMFMMGDNRDRSLDSRYWGFADENDAEGRALFIYFPWEEEKAETEPVWYQLVFWYKFVDWNRIGEIIH